jgi:hypothetical protein
MHIHCHTGSELAVPFTSTAAYGIAVNARTAYGIPVPVLHTHCVICSPECEPVPTVKTAM